MPPIETYQGKIEFTLPREGLKAVRLALARIEGVEPGDTRTAKVLAAEQGLILPTEEEMDSMGKVEKTLLRPVNKALFGFMGDGSYAFLLLGRRQELPVADRGLVILASRTGSDHFLQVEKDWPTAALLLAASQEGTTFNAIEKRISKKMGGLMKLLTRLQIRDEGGKEIEETIQQLGAIWGDSAQALADKKSSLEEKMETAVNKHISELQPVELLEIQRNIKEMKMLATGTLRASIENAEERLGAILETQKERLEGVSKPLSCLGRVLVMERAKKQIEPIKLPTNKSDIVNQVIEAALGLQELDYRALSVNDKTMVDQVRRRMFILKGASALSATPDDLLALAEARRKELVILNERKIEQLPSYHLRPETIGKVLASYEKALESKEITQQEFEVIKQGEVFVVAYKLIDETSDDMEEARQEAVDILKGLDRESPMYIETDLDRDDTALEILGITRPRPPDMTAKVSDTAKAKLLALVDKIPDRGDLDQTEQTLYGIFDGKEIGGRKFLVGGWNAFLRLLMANLPS